MVLLRQDVLDQRRLLSALQQYGFPVPVGKEMSALLFEYIQRPKPSNMVVMHRKGYIEDSYIQTQRQILGPQKKVRPVFVHTGKLAEELHVKAGSHDD